MGVKDVNMCMYTGRWTEDPVVKKTPNGNSVVNVSLAVNRGDEEDTADFINVTCWNKLADNVAKFTRKGSKVLVQGETNNRKYRTKSGEERMRCDCVAQKVQFLDTKERTADEPKNAQIQQAPSNDFGYNFDSEDLPF